MTRTVRFTAALSLVILTVVAVSQWLTSRDRHPPSASQPIRSQDASVVEAEFPTGDADAPPPNPEPLVDSAAATISTNKIRTRDERDQRILSPDDEDWPTEAFAESVMKQLHHLSDALSHANGIQRERVASLLTEDFRATAIPPSPLVDVFHHGTIRARSAPLPVKTPTPNLDTHGFLEELDVWRRSWPAGQPLEGHFKVTRVSLGPDWSTRVLVEFASRGTSLFKQANASWECQWAPRGDGLPQLRSLQVRDYRESEVQVNGSPWFTDCTTAVTGLQPELMRQFGLGHHDWLQRIERVHRFDTSVRNGLAVGDVNGDGLDDVYVAQPPGLPNRLFIQQPDGSANEQSRAWGVDYLDQTSSVLLCDLDNDGDQDLILGTPVGVLLHENLANGSYALRQTLDTDYDVQSLAAADYDLDGKLDLFVCVYRREQPVSGQPFLYRDASGGGRNKLFHNEITTTAWTFVDATNATGIAANADRYSFAASWEDYDADGDPDLYVANDFGPNSLYENREGSFVEIAHRAGVLDIGSGMSVSWGDYNADGRMDLYVGNMFSSAGQRVTTHPAFRLDDSQEYREHYQRLAKGNSLFENSGNGTFREVGQPSGVELGRWAWTSLFVDLNNDGWEDLLVANGYITTDDSGDL